MRYAFRESVYIFLIPWNVTLDYETQMPFNFDFMTNDQWGIVTLRKRRVF